MKFKNEQAKIECLNFALEDIKNELTRVQYFKGDSTLAIIINSNHESRLSKITYQLKLIQELKNKDINYDINSETFEYSNLLVLPYKFLEKRSLYTIRRVREDFSIEETTTTAYESELKDLFRKYTALVAYNGGAFTILNDKNEKVEVEF